MNDVDFADSLTLLSRKDSNPHNCPRNQLYMTPAARIRGRERSVLLARLQKDAAKDCAR